MWSITEARLKEFWTKHHDAEAPLVAWIKEMEAARYESPTQVKNRHRSADFVKDKVIFDIGGNKYRLIVRFRYARPSARPPLNGIALVKFIDLRDDGPDHSLARRRREQTGHKRSIPRWRRRMWRRPLCGRA